MKRLQVKLSGQWEYVFCYNELTGIVTTKNRKKALPASDITFFEKKYGNSEFRKEPT